MRAIEFETTIDEDGVIQLPERYRKVYGQQARFVVLLPGDEVVEVKKTIDPMRYSNTVDWPVDGMEYQRQARSDWE